MGAVADCVEVGDAKPMMVNINLLEKWFDYSKGR